MQASDFLPKTLSKDMACLQRRHAIAKAALDIPDADKRPWDIFRATTMLTAQSKGIIAERMVCELMKGERVSASLDTGDFVLDGRHYEVKSSFTPGKANIRQIRPWQDVDYIVLHANVEDAGDCQCFQLTHAQMLAEVDQIGSLSHGTRTAVETNVNREYSITFSTQGRRNTETRSRWEAYRAPDLEALLF